MYLIPDLTGENELYKVDNDQRMIITTDQVVSFNDPIFADSLQVTALGTVNKVLVKGADWNFRPEDRAIEAMSAMKLVDINFNRTLIKSIVILKPFVGAEYRINCSYQRLYPVYSKKALYPSNEPLTVTPDLIRHMLEMLQRHDYLLAPIKDVHTVTDKNCLLLEADPNKERTENYIVEEEHLINVPENVSIIHPIGGPFFKDSLTVKHVESGMTLVENEHYKVFGVDYHKTAASSNTSGVYRFILFLGSFVGSVKISYHAYGGDPTLEDIRALDETNNNLIKYIIDSQLLTPETVSTAPPIILIRNKLEEMEENMRRLAATGRPTYGDVSSGGCLKKRIAANDTDHHWWTIASLYKVDGSSDVFVADTMKLRIQTFYTKFAFDAIVNVNLLNPSRIMNVNVISANYPKGYDPFLDYSELENIIRPQFRVIWNDNTVNQSGAYLQIGMRLKTVAEETIVVEDWSGPESAWKLIPSPAESVLPEDSIITLPNPNHIWDKLNPDSRVASQLMPFENGHLIWAGNESLNRPSSGWKSLQLVHFLEPEVDIRKIKRMRLDLEEVGAARFPVMLDFISGSYDLNASSSFTYNGKPAYVTARIYLNPVSKNIEVSLSAEIVAGLASTQLDLRHVIIYT